MNHSEVNRGLYVPLKGEILGRIGKTICTMNRSSNFINEILREERSYLNLDVKSLIQLGGTHCKRVVPGIFRIFQEFPSEGSAFTG